MELAIYIYDALSQEQWQTSSLTDVCGKLATDSPQSRVGKSDRPSSDRQLHHSVAQLHSENLNLAKAEPSAAISVVWDGLMWFDGIVNLPLNLLNGENGENGENFNQPVNNSVNVPIIHQSEIISHKFLISQSLTSQSLTSQSLTSQSIRHWLIRLWLALPMALLSQITLSLFAVAPSHSYTHHNSAQYAFCEPIYLCRTHHVLEVQQLLAQKGYYRAALDGIYGEATWSATRQFQQEYVRGDGASLAIDGIAGPLTTAALHNLPPTTALQNLANPDPLATEQNSGISPDPAHDNPANLTPEKSKVNPKPNVPEPSPINADQDPVALTPAAEDDTKPPVNIPVNIVPAQREVRFMQALLQQAGFYNGPVNGIYDAATHEAIIQAQKDLGQVLTGEWNEQLATVLREQVNPRSG